MGLLPQSTLDFYEDYAERVDEFRTAAAQAQRFIARQLEGRIDDVHLVVARHKAPLSLLDKLRRKEYADPAAQVRDLIGVRVITYYPDDSERAAMILRESLDVDEAESFDKLDELEPTEFGYRSIHLVGRLTAEHQTLDHQALSGKWFEVQVRSLLQHAWAEVEHELVYKSGTEFSRPVKRQFGALAGTLEVLDSRFQTLRSARDHMVNAQLERYGDNEDGSASLDGARLIALLEYLLPTGASLRTTAVTSLARAARIEKLLVNALETVGVTTADQLRVALDSDTLGRSLEEHAALVGVTPENLSHLVVVISLLWHESHDVLNKQFPELRFDAQLATTLGFEPIGLTD